MTAPQIRLKTEGFRAIGSANIIIDGITVVAGENGSGKSTLSKLLYYLFKATSNYELLISKELESKLQNVFRFMDIAINDLYPVKGDVQKMLNRDYMVLRSNIGTLNEEQMEAWRGLIIGTSRAFAGPVFESIKERDLIQSRVQRLNSIAQSLLGQGADLSDASLLFERVAEFVVLNFREAFEKAKERPNLPFKVSLRNAFSSGKLPDVFEVFEFGDQIVSMDKRNLGIPYSIENVIYTDTPMMVGVYSLQNEHWRDLNNLLQKKGSASFSDISNTISRDIISGDISITENHASLLNDFSFKREDGSIFNLLDCATGVKSFAILQLLLKNGSINDKTLLIIDEPESHLHPQWIIEYARLIVLLNKHAKIKFFIASHNPDMVSAIKYISAKEGTEDKLNFYLAKKTTDSYLYVYEHLKAEIDPIFTSFNIAIDRINQYGI